MAAAAVAPLRISDDQFQAAKHTLDDFVAIPCVSNRESPYHAVETLQAAADFASDRLRALDFDVRQVNVNNSAPFVIAKKVNDAALKTVTLYAHYDVQPVEDDKWDTPPFVMTERDGRLYGRGASDDKAGIVTILAALNAYKEADRYLPCNVIVFLEGEEEIGSPNMIDFLAQEAAEIQSVALIVLDGMNRDVETGTLTSSTRGLVSVEMTLRALKQPHHSGIGCLAPDVAQVMAGAVASLRNTAEIPGLMLGATGLTAQERVLLRANSITAAQYAKDVGLLEGGRLRGHAEVSIYEKIQTHPSVSVVNMTCGKRNGGNSIQAEAHCEIGVRIVAGQEPELIGQALIAHLKSQAALEGYVAEFIMPVTAHAWKADPSKPISRAYMEALDETFPRGGLMPCGGTIPLFNDFERTFPDMELLMPALEDPDTAAHSHNESQSITVFRRSIDALIVFFSKMG